MQLMKKHIQIFNDILIRIIKPVAWAFLYITAHEIKLLEVIRTNLELKQSVDEQCVEVCFVNGYCGL